MQPPSFPPRQATVAVLHLGSARARGTLPMAVGVPVSGIRLAQDATTSGCFPVPTEKGLSSLFHRWVRFLCFPLSAHPRVPLSLDLLSVVSISFTPPGPVSLIWTTIRDTQTERGRQGTDVQSPRGPLSVPRAPQSEAETARRCQTGRRTGSGSERRWR